MGNATTERTNSILSMLQAQATGVAERAHTPYSDRPVGAVILLSDGQFVPGVRVESASFSLTIPALQNAVTTASSLERNDIVAGCLNRPLRPSERIYLQEHTGADVELPREDTFLLIEADSLPEPTEPLSPFLNVPLPSSDEDGVALARDMAGRAHVPESGFQVGCVALLDEARLLIGTNVEHPDWSSILCAERNVLGTWLSYGTSRPVSFYLSCPKDEAGTPCGACRQILTELTPNAKLSMDRGDTEAPEEALPSALLPGSFSGQSIVHSKL